jgi:hypothetical protein
MFINTIFFHLASTRKGSENNNFVQGLAMNTENNEQSRLHSSQRQQDTRFNQNHHFRDMIHHVRLN